MADGDVVFRSFQLADAESVRRICATVYGGFDIVPIMCKSTLASPTSRRRGGSNDFKRFNTCACYLMVKTRRISCCAPSISTSWLLYRVGRAPRVPPFRFGIQRQGRGRCKRSRD